MNFNFRRKEVKPFNSVWHLPKYLPAHPLFFLPIYINTYILYCLRGKIILRLASACSVDLIVYHNFDCWLRYELLHHDISLECTFNSTPHSPQEQKTLVRIPPGFKVLYEFEAMLLCTIDVICIVCVLKREK
jgi:hypothetical protein